MNRIIGNLFLLSFIFFSTILNGQDTISDCQVKVEALNSMTNILRWLESDYPK